jgi:hypothetical protein
MKQIPPQLTLRNPIWLALLVLLSITTTATAQKVTSVTDVNGNEVKSKDFKNQVTYIVHWSSTKKVKDLHIPKDKTDTVSWDVNGSSTNNIDSGSDFSGSNSSTYVTMLSNDNNGKTSGSFKIKITSGLKIGKLQFTDSRKSWSDKSKTGGLKPAAGSKAIPVSFQWPSMEVPDAIVNDTFARMDFIDNQASDLISVAFSMTGGGPSIFGAYEVGLSAPIHNPWTIRCWANGRATLFCYFPPTSVGMTTWMQGINLNQAHLTNPVSYTVL